MKRNVFALSLIILFTVVFLLGFREAAAQGTFECQMMPPSQSSNCVLRQSNCAAGYKLPPGGCAIYNGASNRSSCEARHDCMSEEAANDCTTKNWVDQCPAGYLDCGRGFQCCKTQKSCDLLPMPGEFSCPTGSGYGIDTALGCIPANDLNSFVGWILGKLIFVASGIAFLLMAFGALQILTSAGSPEKVKAGQELITSALSGLLFIILSLFLLKLIGVDILHIPGFGA